MDFKGHQALEAALGTETTKDVKVTPVLSDTETTRYLSVDVIGTGIKSLFLEL